MKLHSKVSAVAMATMLTVVASACSSSPGDADVLRVYFANIPWIERVIPLIPEFEEEFGVTVEVTQLGDVQLIDQLNVRLNTGSSDMDVMMYRPTQETRIFGSNGYLSDLTPYLDSNPDWDWGDFIPAAVDATTYEGDVVGIPIVTESNVLYYRTDLLEDLGLEVPSTLEELEDAARAIKEEYPEIAGFIARTAASPAVVQLAPYLYSFGGDWQDENGDSALDTPEAKEAFELYGRLIREYGPDNVSTDLNWPESMAIFSQGLAGLSTEADSLYLNATDPELSRVSDTVGFAPFPAGPAGSRPGNIPSWALAVNEFSENKDMAWSFIEWASSKEMVFNLQTDGVLGARTSVWEDPGSLAAYPAGLADAIRANQENGVGHDRPMVFNVAEAREIIGTPLVVAIAGGDLDAALQDAHVEFQNLIDSER